MLMSKMDIKMFKGVTYTEFYVLTITWFSFEILLPLLKVIYIDIDTHTHTHTYMNMDPQVRMTV
jgi:hypothetical protein